jgi:hypothetical protein
MSKLRPIIIRVQDKILFKKEMGVFTHIQLFPQITILLFLFLHCCKFRHFASRPAACKTGHKQSHMLNMNMYNVHVQYILMPIPLRPLFFANNI